MFGQLRNFGKNFNIKTKPKPIGKFRKLKGLQVFRVHKETEEVEEVKLNKMVMVNGVLENSKMYINDSYFYVQALNKKNALRKFKMYGKEQ